MQSEEFETFKSRLMPSDLQQVFIDIYPDTQAGCYMSPSVRNCYTAQLLRCNLVGEKNKKKSAALQNVSVYRLCHLQVGDGFSFCTGQVAAHKPGSPKLPELKMPSLKKPWDPALMTDGTLSPLWTTTLWICWIHSGQA